MPGPYYFAYVADPESFVFGVEHHVEDEEIESYELVEEENDFATLKIVVRNPRAGPLHESRDTWAVFSIDVASVITPILFGQMMAVPVDVGGGNGERVEFTFRAVPVDLFEQKSVLADGLRTAPHYNELFLDFAQRDDPNQVLEGLGKFFHVDRVTHAVTVSSFTEGEDGTELFEADEVPADSVHTDMSATPIMTVGVDASVKWKQKTKGAVPIGGYTFLSYGGDGIISDWPKPLQQLGGGWTVIFGVAIDAGGVQSAISASWSRNWQNKQKRHRNGDTMSIAESETAPFPDAGIQAILTEERQTGVLNPFAVDEEGRPRPINIPPYYRNTKFYILLWQVRTGLILQYQADRERTERVMFVLDADLQPMIGDSLNPQAGEESITFSDVDVGVPILRLRSWYSVRNTAVSLGDIVFPQYRGFPGMRVGQIVVVAGTTGSVQPDFSAIIGDITVDGTAQWASLGPTDPTASAPNWEADTIVSAGHMILPNVPDTVIPYQYLVMPGIVQFPGVGVTVSEGTIVQGFNGSYHVCRLSGTTAYRGAFEGTLVPPENNGITYAPMNLVAREPPWSTTWGAQLVDGSVTWFCLGTSLPTGAHYHICTQAGTTGEFMPPFSSTVGTVTTDGTAEWTNVSLAEIPVGGVPGDIRRSSFFPTDAGLDALEYLLCRARAKLLYGARSVKVTWDTTVERAIQLSCRKNGMITGDPHIPGSEAFGKIIKYTISGGPDGKMRGSVTIGCTIGKGNSVTVSDGEPTYVASGYVAVGYQQYENRTVTPAGVPDVAYTVPVARVVDDGVDFPLSRAEAVEREAIHGSLAEQSSALSAAVAAAKASQNLSLIQPESRSQAILMQRRAQALAQVTVASVLKEHPIWYELQLKPMTNRSFSALYSVATSPLVAPRHIDLEAPPAEVS